MNRVPTERYQRLESPPYFHSSQTKQDYAKKNKEDQKSNEINIQTCRGNGIEATENLNGEISRQHMVK